MAVTDIEGGILIDHVIAIQLYQGEIGAGVLALSQENLVELILNHQGIAMKVLINQGNHLVYCHVPLGSTGIQGHPQKVMLGRNQKSRGGRGQGQGQDQNPQNQTMGVMTEKMES